MTRSHGAPGAPTAAKHPQPNQPLPRTGEGTKLSYLEFKKARGKNRRNVLVQCTGCGVKGSAIVNGTRFVSTELPHRVVDGRLVHCGERGFLVGFDIDGRS